MQEVCDSISLEECRGLYASMPDRIAVVLVAKGRWTKFELSSIMLFKNQVYVHTFLQHLYLLCCNWIHDWTITMVCRTLYSTIFVFIAFDFDHSCFRHHHLKFQVPCIDSVFGVIVESI